MGGSFECHEKNKRRIDSIENVHCNAMPMTTDSYTLPIRSYASQGFLLVKLKSSLRKCYGRHHDDLVDRYGISVSQMTTDMFHLS